MKQIKVELDMSVEKGNELWSQKLSIHYNKENKQGTILNDPFL